MLTVVKVSVAQGAVYARYLEGRAARSTAGDYYLRDGERVEARRRWVLGALGTEAIGVEDVDVPVEADVFRSLMAVVNPATGGPLRRVGGNGDAVGAIDCTFSAPKSVSAVWALARPTLRSGIEAAHVRAGAAESSRIEWCSAGSSVRGAAQAGRSITSLPGSRWFSSTRTSASDSAER